MCFDLAEKCAIVFHTSNSVEITTSTLLRQLIFHHKDSVRDPQTLSPCWSDLRVTLATLQTRTLEQGKRSQNRPDKEK